MISKQHARQRQQNIRQAMVEIAKRPGMSSTARQRGLHSLAKAYKRTLLAEER